MRVELCFWVKNEVQKQDLQDPAQIKIIVINIANNMNININDEQAQQIADTISNSRKVQADLAEFKQELQNVSSQLNCSKFREFQRSVITI
ncbi:MAG: DUF1002 domain-containing protein [Methanobacteriaceae archaeon]|jgi:uncharacterized protein YpuA (DUF1002 family)